MLRAQGVGVALTVIAFGALALIGGVLWLGGWQALVGLVMIGLCIAVIVRFGNGVALAIAIALFALVPFAYLGLREPLSTFSPVIFPLLVAATVSIFRTPPEFGLATLFGIAFVVYLASVSLQSPGGPQHALIWTLLIAVVLIAVPLTIDGSGADFGPTVGVLALLGSVLSIMAIVEYVRQGGPLSDFFAAAPTPVIQKWGSYRVETTMGHPLINGLFFAISGCVSLGVLVRQGRRVFLVSFLLCGVGVVLSGSRSALIGLGVGVIVLIALVSRSRLKSRALPAVVLAVIVSGAFLALSGSFGERAESAEGVGSVDLRGQYLPLLPVLLRATGYLGAGAGSSSTVFEQYGGSAAAYPLESSAVQIVTSFGIPGTILLVAFMLSMVGRSLARGAVVAPAALATYVVTAAGFNLFEAFPGALVLPAVLLILGVMEARLLPVAESRSVQAATYDARGGQRSPAETSRTGEAL